MAPDSVGCHAVFCYWLALAHLLEKTLRSLSYANAEEAAAAAAEHARAAQNAANAAAQFAGPVAASHYVASTPTEQEQQSNPAGMGPDSSEKIRREMEGLHLQDYVVGVPVSPHTEFEHVGASSSEDAAVDLPDAPSTSPESRDTPSAPPIDDNGFPISPAKGETDEKHPQSNEDTLAARLAALKKR